jgi:hypothetical protein
MELVHLDGFITKKKTNIHSGPKKCIHSLLINIRVQCVYIFWATLYIYLLLYLRVVHLFSLCLTDIFGRRSSSVDVVTRLWARPFTIQNRVTVTNFSVLQKTSRMALGRSRPPIQWVPGFISGVQRPGHEIDHFQP